MYLVDSFDGFYLQKECKENNSKSTDWVDNLNKTHFLIFRNNFFKCLDANKMYKKMEDINRQKCACRVAKIEILRNLNSIYFLLAISSLIADVSESSIKNLK